MAQMGPARLEKIGLRKIMLEYLSFLPGDFYSVPIQTFGLPNVGCPFSDLKQNCSHSTNEGRRDDEI
jgi:hypothetical protein